MCIESVRKQRLRAGRRGMLLGGVALAGGAGMPGWASAQAAGVVADGKPSTDGAGGGQGFHSPQSAFPPLQDRPGVVSWRTLGSVSMRQVASLSGTRVKVQGFMMPLQPGERQTHFLLSAVPTTCGFCLPAGPEGIIEIRTRPPGVKVGFDALVLEGTLSVLPTDPMGLLYRLTDAQAAR